MNAISIHRYFKFGTTVRFLQDVKTGFSVHGPGVVIANLDVLFREIEALPLPVTNRASAELRTFTDTLRALPEGTTLSADHAKELTQLISNLRMTLEAELKGSEAFVVAGKRLDTTKLLSDVGVLFAPGVFDALPETARYDFIEAGRCIAFERPTAAAFHLLRGSEGVLRSLYCSFVKRDRIDTMLWGPMAQALQKHRKAKAHDSLLRNLDNIRVSFRNPTQHPDKIYDIQEAQDLWGLCIEAVNRMTRVMGGGT